MLHHHVLLDQGFGRSMNSKLDPSLRQFAVDRHDGARDDFKRHTRMAPGEPLDDGENRSARRVLAACDPQFPCGRIGEMFYILQPLSQLIENRKAASNDGAAKWCGLDAMRAAIKEANTERMLKIVDCS